MWMSGQHKRPAEQGEGHVGVITTGGGEPAVLLDCERRGLQVYAPGGYRWTPRTGQRVLVIQGQGEIPCVVGVRQGEQIPGEVTVEAGVLSLAGSTVNLAAGEDAAVQGKKINLNGQVYVNGEKLEALIARIVRLVLAGAM